MHHRTFVRWAARNRGPVSAVVIATAIPCFFIGTAAASGGSSSPAALPAPAPTETVTVTVTASPSELPVVPTTAPATTAAPVITETPAAVVTTPAPVTTYVPATVYSPPPVAAYTPDPVPVYTPAPQPASVSYANCSEARAAGVTPIYRGQPGYASHLDRDGDGIACE